MALLSCSRSRYSDFLEEYEAGIKTYNKYEHVKAARMLAEYFDGQGIIKPTVKDWQAFKGHVKYHYYEGTNFTPYPHTLMKCLDRAYRFYEYCKQGQEKQAVSA